MFNTPKLFTAIKQILLYQIAMLFIGSSAVSFAQVVGSVVPETSKSQEVFLKDVTQVRFRGFNLSGAEYGPEANPGIYLNHYIYPPGEPGTYSYTAEFPYYKSRGANIVRLPFLWERLQPGLTRNSSGKEAFNSAELGYLKDTVTLLKNSGFTVILDPHNYARYPHYPTDDGNNIIGVASSPTGEAFANFWMQLAGLYKNDPQVIFGIVNEPNTMSTAAWVTIANQVIAGIRSTGATNLILVPGNFWTSAWSWSTMTDASGLPSSINANAMLSIVDSANNYAYDAHLYLDPDSSGTTNECVGPDANGTTVGVARLTSFTAWLYANSKRAFLGEVGGGDPWIGANNPSNAVCKKAVREMLSFLNKNSKVWLGWTWWTGGPWANSATFRVEPEYNSGSYKTLVDGFLMPWLVPFLK